MPSTPSSIRPGHQFILFFIVALALCLPGTVLAYEWLDTFAPHHIDGGSVRAQIVHDGDLWIGGNFDQVGLLPAKGIASWDGSHWSTPAGFEADPESGVVKSLAVHDGALIVCGEFEVTDAEGDLIQDVASWDGEDWTALPSSALSAGYSELIVHDGDLYAAGDWLTSSDPMIVEKVQRWDFEQQDWVPVAPPLDSDVLSMVVHDGVLWAAGDFTSSDGSPLPGLAFLSEGQWQLPSGLTGSTAGGWDSCLDLEVHEGDLWVSGKFFTLGGFSATNIACWNGATWSEPGGGISAGTAGISGLFSRPIGLVASGEFSSLGPIPCDGEAIWMDGSWYVMDGVGNAYDVIHSSIEYQGHHYFGGDFEYAGDLYLPQLARWEDGIWKTHPGLVHMGLSGYVVHDIAPYDGGLAVVGGFESAGQASSANVAVLHEDHWQSLGAGTDGSIKAVAEYNGELVVGGDFDQAGEVAAHKLARWDGTQWLAIPGSDAMGDDHPSCMAVYEGVLYIGSIAAHSYSDDMLWTWDGTTLSSEIDPGIIGSVRALHVHQGDLYVGGSWYSTSLHGRILRYDGDQWHDVPGEPDEGAVRAMTSQGTDLLVSVNASLQRVNADGWQDIGEPLLPNQPGNPNDYFINDIMVFGADIIVTGYLGGSESVPFTNMGIWTPSAGWHALSLGAPNDQGNTLHQWNDDILVGGAFAEVDGMPSNSLAALQYTVTAISDDLPVARSSAMQVFPNPFNPRTTLHLDLAQDSHVQLRLFDLRGRCVRELMNGSRRAGHHQVTWDGCDHSGRAMPSGVYLAQLSNNGQPLDSKTLTLVR